MAMSRSPGSIDTDMKNRVTKRRLYARLQRAVCLPKGFVQATRRGMVEVEAGKVMPYLVAESNKRIEAIDASKAMRVGNIDRKQFDEMRVRGRP
jgi:hypothetical protein